MIPYARTLAAACVALLLAPLIASTVQAQTAGARPVPRFVSLKSDRVNVRQGPSRDHQVVWTFTRAALPVEITAEFENWRRIRDSEGQEGWVQQALLSGRRTALVAPWRRGATFDLFARPNGGGDVRAKLESGVLVTVRSCTSGWCRVAVDNQSASVDGFIQVTNLWGVYPNETVD